MAVNTITVGPGTLTLGEDGTLSTLSSQVTACRLVPTVDNEDPIDVLSGEQAPGDRSESWALAGTLLQDLGAADSTTEFLFEHRGEQLPFQFIPATAAGKELTGTVTVEAIEMGGDAKTKPTSDFEWQLVGFPAIGTVGGGGD